MRNQNKHQSVKEKETKKEEIINFFQARRNRSLSSIIRIPGEFVPHLHPKRAELCPSPILLSGGHKKMLGIEKRVNHITKETDALSFDGDDLEESDENSNSDNEDIKKENDSKVMNDMRKVLNRIRSKTVFLNKDDSLLNRYSKVLIHNRNLINIECDDFENMENEQLKKKNSFVIPFKHKLIGSILGFLEESKKEAISRKDNINILKKEES